MFWGRTHCGIFVGEATLWGRFESRRCLIWRVSFELRDGLLNRTDAEDLVQETLMEALKSFHRFAQGTNCRAWLVSIMYHHQSKRDGPRHI